MAFIPLLPDFNPYGSSLEKIKDSSVPKKTPKSSGKGAKIQEKAKGTLKKTSPDVASSPITSHKVTPKTKAKGAPTSKKTSMPKKFNLKGRVKVQKDKGATSSFVTKALKEPLQLHHQEKFVLTHPSSSQKEEILIESYDDQSEIEDFPEKDLDSFIQKSTIRTPHGTFFSGLNILIFKNNYSGTMPTNGIRQKDFKKLLKLEADITQGRGIFSINGDSKFINFTKETLKTLLLSEQGRHLMLGLIQKDKKIKIIEEKSDKQEIHKHPDGSFTINLIQDAKEFSYSKKSDGSIEIHKMTPSRALFHELTHALLECAIAPNLPQLPPDLEEIWQIEEEIKAIIGLTAAQYIKLQEFVKNMIRDPSAIESDLKSDTDSMSEEELAAELEAEDKSFGAICRAFENTYNLESDFPIRIDHLGVDKPDDLRISGPELSEEMHLYFSKITEKMVKKEMKEFFAINPDIATKVFEGKPVLDDIFEEIFAAPDEKILKSYIESGFPLNAEWDSCNLFQIAVLNGRLDLAKYLFSLPQSKEFIAHLDTQYNSLLHFALGHQDPENRKKMIQFLIDQKLDPMQLNLKGDSPILFAIKLGLTEELPILLSRLDKESYAEAFELAIDLGNTKCLDPFLRNADQNCLQRVALYACQKADDSTIHHIFKFMDVIPNIFLTKDTETDENLIHKTLSNRKLTTEEKVILISYLKGKQISLLDMDIEGNTCRALCASANLLVELNRYEQRKIKEKMAKIRGSLEEM